MNNIMKILVPAVTIITLFAAVRSFAKEPAIGFCVIEQLSIGEPSFDNPKTVLKDLMPPTFKKLKIMGATAIFDLPQKGAKIHFDLASELELFTQDQKIGEIVDNLIDHDAIPNVPSQIKLFMTNCGH